MAPSILPEVSPQDRPGSDRLGGPQAWWDIWPRAPDPPGELRQRSVAIPARGDDNDLVPGVRERRWCRHLNPADRGPPPREAPQRPPARAAVLPQGPCIQGRHPRPPRGGPDAGPAAPPRAWLPATTSAPPGSG